MPTYNPIWKDYDVNLGAASAGSIAFRLSDYDTSTVLYQGTAYAKPGASYIYTRINDVFADYLVRGMTEAGETETPSIHFKVEKYNTNAATWESLVDDLFVPDWTYDETFDPSSDNLNDPILDILMPGQYLPVTLNAAGSVTATITYTENTGDMNYDFNADFYVVGYNTTTYTVTTTDPFETAWIDLTDYPTATQVTVNGITYRVGGGCNQFVLYYVNERGGWDTMVVTAKTNKRDDVTRHTIEVYADNSNNEREKKNYINELGRKWTFNTRYMNAESSEKMHNLLNSPHVWMHDVVNGELRPIVLTGATSEYKTGTKLYTYAIEAELAQTRIRR